MLARASLASARRGTLAVQALDMFRLLGALRRKNLVAAQFGTGEQAQEYADAHAIARPDGQHRAARIRLLHELLARVPEGELLDAACGPGVLARSLRDSPVYNYRVTLLDRSEAMIRYCVAHAHGNELRAIVGDLEALPFGDASFDVTVSTGALEYTDARAAVRQLSRVTRPGGTVLVSMLNPVSPYWLSDWFLCQPATRLICWTMKALRIPAKHPDRGKRTGIRALRSPVLEGYLRQSGLVPVDVVYFGLTPLVRPLDRIAAVRRWADQGSGRRLTTGGGRHWLATGYVIVAKREARQPAGRHAPVRESAPHHGRLISSRSPEQWP
jgi:ubiquinone/menaquinone biosynthesis C-methylase UbiE